MFVGANAGKSTTHEAQVEIVLGEALRVHVQASPQRRAARAARTALLPARLLRATLWNTRHVRYLTAVRASLVTALHCTARH